MFNRQISSRFKAKARQRLWALFLSLHFHLFLFSSGFSAQPPGVKKERFVEDEVIVRFKEHVHDRDRVRVHASIRAAVKKKIRSVKELDLVKLPRGLSVRKALEAYRSRPDVHYAEPNYIVHTTATPNDPRFIDLWGLQNTGQLGGTPGADIDAPGAWNFTTGDNNVVVAVIDTGIDYLHQDLSANMFRNVADCNHNGLDDDGNGFVDDCFGINTAYDISDPWDDHSHGTHVAGTIGGLGNNSIGVVGVNWNVQLMACKFLDYFGSGTIADAIDCLNYVAMMKDRGFNIVATNNSWGGGGFSQALYDAIDAHRQRGILFIAAAGNAALDNDSSPFYPARYNLPNVIAVAATDRFDGLADFSNYGRRTVHIGAPGHEILSSTIENTYSIFSGTSMATPHVAGVAALLKAQDPSRDWRAIKNLILAGGENVPSVINTVSQKRLNAHGALTCSNSTVSSRVRPIGDTITGTIGIPIDLAFLNINCANPNGNLTVTVNPGGQIITLLDDGVGPDQSAGDGIYSGEFIPPALGTFTLSFSNGDIVTVQILQNYIFTPVPFNYRTITGTNLNLFDDEVAQIGPPFAILFGGGSFTDLSLNDNGTISFTGAFASSPWDNSPIPYSSVSTLVAPFWDDLRATSSTAKNVWWGVTGSAPNRELVIEWRDIPNWNCSPTASVKFQVVFFEGSSDILFNYADTVFGGGCRSWEGMVPDNGASATVGVQVSENLGTQFSFQSPSLNNNTALLWTLQSPNPVIRVTPSSQDFGTVIIGGSADRSFTVTNVGGDILTGNASTSAPFSIIGGGSYTLSPGQSQVTAIRFIPAAPGTFLGNVNFTGGGDASGVLTGVGSLPVVTISATDASAAEVGLNPGILTVNRPGSTALPLTVDYTIGGTATNGVDYQTLAGSVVIPAGQSSATITVTPINDSLFEGDETVEVTLAANTAYAIGSPASATVTIMDTLGLVASPTTAPPGGSVTAMWAGIASPTPMDWVGLYLPGTADTSYLAWIYVSCSQSPGSPRASGSCPFSMPVGAGNYELRLLADNGYTRLATSNGLVVASPFDYTLSNSGSITIVQGSSGSNTITRNLVSGLSQSVTLSASGLPAGATDSFASNPCNPTCSSILTISTTASTPLGTFPITVTGTPLNKTTQLNLVVNAVALPVVTVTATDATAAEAGLDPGTFTASRTGSTASALTVNYTVGGTATNGVDYQMLSGSVPIPAGSSSATITVTPIDDSSVEGNETVTVTLAASAAYTIGAPNNATITIVDNDSATGPTLTASPGAVAPGGTVTATWSGIASPSPTDWVGLYLPGTADTSYLAWIYVSCSQSPGSARASGSCPFSLPVGAGIYELRLLANDAYTRLAASNALNVGSPLPVATIVATDVTAAEAGLDPGTFTVSRTGSTAAPLTVNYTLGGTASHGADYQMLGGSVTIPVGFSSATIAVIPIDDVLIEGNETVVATLSPNAAYLVGAPASGTVVIVDNDVDTTPPETMIISGPAGTITVNSATFGWAGTDNVQAASSLVYAYRLDPLEPNFSPFNGATMRSYTNLANGTYTFYVKAKDQAGNEDPTPASLSFTVSVTGPVLSASPVIVPAGGTVTATWGGIAAPTATDWIGLFAPGAADANYLAWIYVSCAQTDGDPKASGSCPFPLPWGSGTYELRLLANDGFARQATSNPFTMN